MSSPKPPQMPRAGSRPFPLGQRPPVFRPVPPRNERLPNDSRIGFAHQRINVIDYKFSTFSAQAIGTDLNNVFPLVKRVGSYTFTANCAIVGVTLSSSITNVTTDVAGIFILPDGAEAAMSITGDIPCLIAHTSFKNALAGSPVSANRTNGVAFGDNTAMKMNGGTKMGIYMCAGNDATNLLLATVSMIIVPIA